LQARLRSLQKNIGYEFQRSELLNAALTHRSVGAVNNERLEFLGDGALNFVIAAEIYRRRKNFSEGQLSRLRATLVRGETLTEIAREIDLGDCLVLGPGERKSGGFTRGSILADALEAIIGAVYLDGGFDAAEHLVKHLFAARLEHLPASEPVKDPKTRLQEYLQGRGIDVPGYRLLHTSGQAHELKFSVSCTIDALALEAQETGTSRRRAEQAAAAAMLELIEQQTQVNHG
jgi:ribonuclease-3